MKDVVEELILVVPQPDAPVLPTDVAHGLGDVQEVLEELGGDILVHPVVLGQLQRDAHEIQGIHRHPAGAIRLIDMPAGRQLAAAVEDPDVVEPEEATLEHVAALRILAVDPPGEVQHQLVEHALQECQVALAPALLAVDLEHAPRGPGMHRWIDVPEGPLVSGYLPVRVHVPLARQEHELLLGKFCVEIRERNAVEGEVPGCVPGVFPFVRHRDDVGIVQMLPLAIATVASIGRRWRL